MKYIAGLTALLMTICLLFSPIVPTVTVSAATTQNKAAVLTSLGFIGSGANMNSEVTRSQFVSMLMKILAADGMGAAEDVAQYYTDVTANLSDIAAAIKLGVLTPGEDRLFMPDQPITHAQALKMIICGMGYNYQATSRGGFPIGYLSVAVELKIATRPVSDETVKMSDAVEFFYNMLEVNIPTSKSYGVNAGEYEIVAGRNILSEYHNIYKGKGIVDGNRHTTLLEPMSNLKSNEVMIDGNVFKRSTATGQSQEEEEEEEVESVVPQSGAPVPGTVFEAEELPVLTSGATTTVYEYSLESNGKGIKLDSNSVGEWIEFTIDVEQEGTYDLRVGVNRHPTRGKFATFLPSLNSFVGDEFDQSYSSGAYELPERIQEWDIGNVRLAQGPNKVRFVVMAGGKENQEFTLAFGYIKLADTSHGKTPKLWTASGVTVEVATDDSLRFECETTPHKYSESLDGGSVTPVEVFDFNYSSGGKAAKLNSTQIGDYIEYTVDLPEAGRYEVKVAIQTHNSRGKFKLYQADLGEYLGSETDQFDVLNGAVPERVKVIEFGVVNFDTPGEKTFRFEVTGQNNESQGFTLAFDYINLVPYTGTEPIENTEPEDGGEETATSVDDMEVPMPTETRDMLGYSVEYYYRHDKQWDENSIVSIIPSQANNRSIRIPDHKLQDYRDNTFVYNRDSVEVRARVALGATVIYNGRVFNRATRADLLPTNGFIRLLDNNGDGVYDIVFVEAYKNYIVTSANATDMKITDRRTKLYDPSSSLNVLDINEDDTRVRVDVYQGGVRGGFNLIKENDVISVYESKQDPKSYTIYISDQTVQGGILEEISEGNYKIDGNSYKLADSFKDPEVLTVNLKGTFYIDNHGKLAGYERGDEVARRYGLLLGVQVEQSVEATVHLEILTHTGTEKLKCARKLTLDGAKVQDTAINGYTPLWNSSIDPYGLSKSEVGAQNLKVIGFEVNADNEIKLIDTPGQIKTNEDDNLVMAYTNTTRMYKSNFKQFTKGSSVDNMYLSGSVIIFRDFNYDGYQADRKLSVKKIEAQALRDLTGDSTYYVEGYTTATDFVDIVFVRQVRALEASTNKDSMIVVERVSKLLDDDGEYIYRLVGYRDNAPFSAMIKADTNAETEALKLGKGDVVVITRDRYTQEINDIYRLFQMNLNDKTRPPEDKAQTSGTNYNRTFYGVVEQYKNQIAYFINSSGTLVNYPVYTPKVYEFLSGSDVIINSSIENFQEGQTVFFRIKNEAIYEIIIIR